MLQKIQSIAISSLSFLLISILITSSCKKEEIADQGIVPPPAVILPCDTMTCPKNAYCANATCHCNEGFKGPNCDIQITPQKMKVLGLKLLKFPEKKRDGSNWDILGKPDIFFEFMKGTTVFERTRTNWNESSDVWIFSYDVYLNKPEEMYQITMYDEDDFLGSYTYDYMGRVKFYPYNGSNGFPSTLWLENSSGSIKIELYVEYLW